MADTSAEVGAAAEEQPKAAPELELQSGPDLTAAGGNAESAASPAATAVASTALAPAPAPALESTHVPPDPFSTQHGPLSPIALDAEVPAEAQTKGDLPGADESLSLVLDALGQGSTSDPTSTSIATSTAAALESDLLSIAAHTTDATADLAAAYVQADSQQQLQPSRGEEHEQVSQYQLGQEFTTTDAATSHATTPPISATAAAPPTANHQEPQQGQPPSSSETAVDQDLSLSQPAHTVEQDQQVPAAELNGSPAPAPASEAGDMSNPPHYPGIPGQPMGYPGQASYAAAGINAQYGYSTAPQSPDGYQGSPTTPHTTMSLPSMRTFDQAQQHPQPIQPQSHPQTAQYGTALSPGASSVPGSVSYYQTPAPLASHNTYSNIAPDPMNPRYPLPPNDHSMLIGGRHKKVSDPARPVLLGAGAAAGAG